MGVLYAARPLIELEYLYYPMQGSVWTFDDTEHVQAVPSVCQQILQQQPSFTISLGRDIFQVVLYFASSIAVLNPELYTEQIPLQIEDLTFKNPATTIIFGTTLL